jgi:MFS family permease
VIHFNQFEESADVKVNFYANLFDGAIYVMGMAFISLVTVIPVLIKKLGGSNIAIGMIPVIWMFGLNFPQILIANYTGKLPFKKKFVLVTALIQRFPWLTLSFLIYFFVTNVPNATAQLLILGTLFIASVTGGINLPAWYDLVSKITPVQLRGRLFAFRFVLGALLGIGSGALVTHILDRIPYPDNFALLFLLAFSFMMISYFFVTLLREKHPNIARQELTGNDYYKNLVVILKENTRFRNFLIADALMMAALMADAFYAVNALKRFNLPEKYAGYFLVIMMVSMIFGNLVFGYLADRFGHRNNLLVAAASTSIICIIAIWAPVLEVYFIVFAGAALTTSLFQLSRLAMVVELCEEENRPIFVALTNMITAPFILTGLLGGLLADKFGYMPVFILAGIFSTSSMIWWIMKVPEPRIRNR